MTYLRFHVSKTFPSYQNSSFFLLNVLVQAFRGLSLGCFQWSILSALNITRSLKPSQHISCSGETAISQTFFLLFIDGFIWCRFRLSNKSHKPVTSERLSSEIGTFDILMTGSFLFFHILHQSSK